MAAKIRQELLPALGIAGGFLDTGTRPKNAEAYDLYLHSLALPRTTPGRTRTPSQSWSMWSKSIPPTLLLGAARLRCYYDADYSDGGEPMFQRSNKAYERALQLDPNRIFAASQLITDHLERGGLRQAYKAGQEMVERRPESAQAHFARQRLYRYCRNTRNRIDPM